MGSFSEPCENAQIRPLDPRLNLVFQNDSVVSFYNENPGNVTLVTLFKNCSQNFDPSINMALVNVGLLHNKEHEEFPKKSSSLKRLVRF